MTRQQLRAFGLGFFLLSYALLNGQSRQATVWADSILNEMTIEEKIGQLFIHANFSNKKEEDYRKIEQLIETHHLGGLIFMQGEPEKQARLVNRYQKTSKVPLLISQDAEWGLSMRLKRVPRYPKNMTLGAIYNDSLLYELGRQMALDLRKVGVRMNFAPVVDVNNNPANPVINYRSFGENRYNVARKGLMLSKGLQTGGVIACAKHFPGHGDTDTDSHHALPIMNHSKERLDTLELYPFSKLTRAGIGAVMTGHLYIPALDSTPNRATSLSPIAVNNLLRNRMNYKGLIITDGLNMQGVYKYYPKGEAALQAFLAGNDMLLFPADLSASMLAIKNALRQGKIQPTELERRVRRILIAKHELGLYRQLPIPEQNVVKRLMTPEAQAIKEKLYESAITLAKNERLLVPLRKLDKRKIALVQIGSGSGSTFHRTLAKYGPVANFSLKKGFTPYDKSALMQKLKGYNTIIIGVYGMKSQASKDFGIGANTISLSEDLRLEGKETILTLFGSPYALKFFGSESAILVAYESVKEAQEAAGEAIFGGNPITGRLPVTASPQFKEGYGIMIRKPVRFGFSLPEAHGMDSRWLAQIDTMANLYIKRKAMPGCEVLVLKDNDIVYQKGFGHTEYGTKGMTIHPYLNTYDLASVTKVAATTSAVMFMVERGMLDLDKPISTYLPEFKGNNKGKLTLRRIMQHNAGLPGWLSVYQDTYANRKKKTLNTSYYSFSPSRSHQSEIAPSLYGSEELDKLFLKKLKEAEVRKTSAVRYSDVGFILAGMVVERVSRKSLDDLSQYLFFRRLGMDHTYFNPHQRGREKFCPPTEKDNIWRQAIIRGYVHDQNAALLGGVAGHAGLFSNVYDLTKWLYMLKNDGMFGGERFLRKETIESFTKQQLTYNRKGLGWDKPELKGRSSSPCSEYASKSTFGHTGFTGTAVWVDPDNDLIFVFLSNRTYPDASNRLLLRENVRIKLMDIVYQSMKKNQVKRVYR